MSDNLKAYENEIRKDERAKFAKVIDRARDLLDRADILLMDLVKATGQDAPRGNGSTPPAKAKRKPVAVTNDQIAKVKAALQEQSPLSISDIDRALHMGPKFVGAAVRCLVNLGEASETTRGRFRAVAQPAVADGAEQ